MTSAGPTPPPAGPFTVIDAGPAINFCASGHETILVNALRQQGLYAPASVRNEVHRKSKQDKRFKDARGRFEELIGTHLTVLPDDASNQDLVHASQQLNFTSMKLILETSKDLGEIMVVLHGYSRALRGERVILIIDDRGRRQLAAEAAALLMQVRSTGVAPQSTPVGALRLVNTEWVIGQRLNTPDIPTQKKLRTVWRQISTLDDGLPNHINATGLLTADAWNRPARQ